MFDKELRKRNKAVKAAERALSKTRETDRQKGIEGNVYQSDLHLRLLDMETARKERQEVRTRRIMNEAAKLDIQLPRMSTEEGMWEKKGSQPWMASDAQGLCRNPSGHKSRAERARRPSQMVGFGNRVDYRNIRLNCCYGNGYFLMCLSKSTLIFADCDRIA